MFPVSKSTIWSPLLPTATSLCKWSSLARFIELSWWNTAQIVSFLCSDPSSGFHFILHRKLKSMRWFISGTCGQPPPVLSDLISYPTTTLHCVHSAPSCNLLAVSQFSASGSLTSGSLLPECSITTWFSPVPSLSQSYFVNNALPGSSFPLLTAQPFQEHLSPPFPALFFT